MAFLVLGALLALALPAADAHESGGWSGFQTAVVTVQCNGTTGLVAAVQPSAGVTAPATVIVGEQCAQAVADMLNAHFKLLATYDVSGVGPFFLFSGRPSGGS